MAKNSQQWSKNGSKWPGSVFYSPFFLVLLLPKSSTERSSLPTPEVALQNGPPWCTPANWMAKQASPASQRCRGRFMAGAGGRRIENGGGEDRMVAVFRGEKNGLARTCDVFGAALSFGWIAPPSQPGSRCDPRLKKKGFVGHCRPVQRACFQMADTASFVFKWQRLHLLN